MLAPFVFLTALSGVTAVAVYLALRANKTTSTGKLQNLGRELGLADGSPFLVERHGRSFTAKYIQGGKNTPSTVRVVASVDEVAETAPAGAYREGAREHLPLRPAIILRPETSKDRFGKRWGLNREVQTGDKAFDDAVYLETDSPEEDVRRTLAGEGIHDAVRKLLSSGVTRVQLDPAGLSMVILAPVPLLERFDYLTGLLAQIAAALPLFKVGHATKPRTPTLGIVGLVVGPIVFGISVAAAGRAPIGSVAARVGLGSGFALWLAVSLAGLLFLRGRSDSLRSILLLSVAAAFILPSSTYAAVVQVNRQLDTSPAVEHATTVTRAWSTRSKSSTYYHVAVGSWRPGEDTVEIHPPGSIFYDQAKVGRPILVTTHAGYLGWEWVDTFRWAQTTPPVTRP